MSITAAQCRAGRALVEMSQQELADAASVGLSTVRSFESGKRSPIANNLSAIRNALEAAGIQFIAPGDDPAGPGVALRGDIPG